jgi:hypothetical protein
MIEKEAISFSVKVHKILEKLSRR